MMSIGAKELWIIPALPLAAALILAFFRGKRSSVGSGLAIASLIGSLILSCIAFVGTLTKGRDVYNFTWLQAGPSELKLGFILDPLTGVMLVMVSFISLLIFIYSTTYMRDDANYTRFFCFLSLFCSAMLGVVIANSLVLLFICWEIVGLASFLLIGFWFHKPSAAAAARKAFITTRVADVLFLLGIVWLINTCGTQLFYDHGAGCMENTALRKLVMVAAPFGISAATMIALLIFAGAAGKSGQVPFHVWLPDAMEGPTPVSALIHAATMVAAGVFLVARTYPLMEADSLGMMGISPALTIITWVGAITAIFAAMVAVAQNDIKRILAYSTVSQLGYMMMGLGTGGPAVGMFHLLTHASFKALLFLGAGSVIHGLHGEQDINRMGGLRKAMPVTFFTYAIGMLALTGFPLLFSGFWSKDEILHTAAAWPLSKIPFLLGLLGAFLTAFYMTRQMVLVFFKAPRNGQHAHESPPTMLVPLVLLAICSILVGFLSTPAWPWLESYLMHHHAHATLGKLLDPQFLSLALISLVVVASGYAAGWQLYNRDAQIDIFKSQLPSLHRVLFRSFYIDELYEITFGKSIRLVSTTFDRLERWLFATTTQLWMGVATLGGWFARVIDSSVIDRFFDKSCSGLSEQADRGKKLQAGQVHSYLRALGVGFALLILVLGWGCKS